MKILIIGGTRFQGKYLINHLLEQNYEITVFHRGLHSLSPHTKITEVLGDRNEKKDLQTIPHADYDWLVDTCAYSPIQCKLVSSVLGSQFNKICLISTTYVYKTLFPKVDELSFLKDPISDTTINHQTYGALKVMCEQVYLSIGKDKVLILRPSVIVGHGDHTGRLDFWLRLSQTMNHQLQVDTSLNKQFSIIDVRDLTNFTANALRIQLTGIFNVSGRAIRLSEILAFFTRKHSQERNLTLTTQQLNLLGIEKSHLPYLMTEEDEEFNSQKARGKGLVARSIEDTLRDFSQEASTFILPGFYTDVINLIANSFI